MTARYDRAAGRALNNLDQHSAEDDYHAAMRALPDHLVARVLAMFDGHGRTAPYLWMLQEALDRLADFWGITRDVDPKERLDIQPAGD